MKIEKHLFIIHSVTCAIGAFLAYVLFDGVLQRLAKAFPGYPNLTTLSPGTPPGFVVKIHQFGSLSVLALSVLLIALSAVFTFVKKSEKSKAIITALTITNLLYLLLVFFCHIRSLKGITL